MHAGGIPCLCPLLPCPSDIYIGARDPNPDPSAYMRALYPGAVFQPARGSLARRLLLGDSLAQHLSCFPENLCRTISPLPQGTGGEGARLLQGHRLAVRVLTEGTRPSRPPSSTSLSLASCLYPSRIPAPACHVYIFCLGSSPCRGLPLGRVLFLIFFIQARCA